MQESVGPCGARVFSRGGVCGVCVCVCCGGQKGAGGTTISPTNQSIQNQNQNPKKSRPPDAIGKVIGLGSRSAASAEKALLDDATRERYRQQVPGWRVVPAAQQQQQPESIQQEWSVKDAAAAAGLVAAIKGVCDAEGHAPLSVEAVGASTVVARLSTASLGGLTEADFIVAAKVNALDVSDLLAKKKARFWA